jgi:hypothetical protein
MLEKEGADGMLGVMVGRIQGGIRMMTSKQHVRGSSIHVSSGIVILTCFAAAREVVTVCHCKAN